VTQEEETKAQQRFLVISLVRISGAIMLAVGLAIIAKGLYGLPKVAGYALFLVGVVDFIAMPLLLSKRWKSTPNP
jgi:hypothetical protein